MEKVTARLKSKRKDSKRSNAKALIRKNVCTMCILYCLLYPTFDFSSETLPIARILMSSFLIIDASASFWFFHKIKFIPWLLVCRCSISLSFSFHLSSSLFLSLHWYCECFTNIYVPLSISYASTLCVCALRLWALLARLYVQFDCSLAIFPKCDESIQRQAYCECNLICTYYAMMSQFTFTSNVNISLNQFLNKWSVVLFFYSTLFLFGVLFSCNFRPENHWYDFHAIYMIISNWQWP